MKNEPITIYISKKSINGKTELPGAKLKVTDKDGKVVTDLDGKELEWISSTKEVSFHLPAGTYYLTETIAPEGYELSTETVTFVVKEDGTVDGEIIMYNKPETIEVPNTSSFKTITASLIGVIILVLDHLWYTEIIRKII